MFVLKSSGYATSYYKRFQSTEVDSVKMSNYGQWKTVCHRFNKYNSNMLETSAEYIGSSEVE